MGSRSTTVPAGPAQPSLRLWFWTAPQERVWFGPKSLWTVRASGNTASLSKPTTVERVQMGPTPRSLTSQCFYRLFHPKANTVKKCLGLNILAIKKVVAKVFWEYSALARWQ